MLGNSIETLNANITELKNILADFVCALYINRDLRNNPSFKNHANAAILRLAEAYKRRGEKQLEAGQTEDAKASFNTALSLVNAFNAQDSSSFTITVVPGRSANVGLDEIKAMARFLPRTYAHGISQNGVTDLLDSINNGLNQIDPTLGSNSNLVNLGLHFFSNQLNDDPTIHPPFRCSCGSSAHNYSYDVSLNARIVWAEEKSKTSPQAVIGKANALITMLRSAATSNDGRPIPRDMNQMYARVLSALARAYAKAGKTANSSNINYLQNANALFVFLRGGTLSGEMGALRIDTLNLTLSANEKAKIEIEYYYNRVNLLAAQHDSNGLKNLAAEIYSQHPNDNEYKKILGAALGNIWMLEIDSYSTSKTNIPDAQMVYLNLILFYLSDKNVTFTLPSTNSNELLEGALYALIDCERDYDRALTLSIKHNKPKIAAIALQRKIDSFAANGPNSLPYRIAQAVLFKHLIDGIPTSGDDHEVWQVLRQIAIGVCPNLTNLSGNAAQNGIERIQLGYQLGDLAIILEKITDPGTLTNGARGARSAYSALLQNQVGPDDLRRMANYEKSLAETKLINAILSSNLPKNILLEKLLALANIYLEKGNYEETLKNLDAARTYLQRSEMLYRAIIVSPAALDLSAAFLTEDLRQVIQKALAKDFELEKEQKIQAYFNFAEAIRRSKLNNNLDPAAGQNLMNEIIGYYRQAIQLCGNTPELQAKKELAEDGIRETTRVWVEICIKNKAYETAISTCLSLMRGIDLQDPNDLKLYINCAGDLAWAYNAIADDLPDTVSGRAQATSYRLMAAGIYHAILYGNRMDSLPAQTPDTVLDDLINNHATILTLLSTTETSKIKLSLAESLKAAAGHQNEALLTTALSELEGIPLNDPNYAIAQVVKIEALVALHICLADQGRITDAETKINEAIALADQGTSLTGEDRLRFLQAQTWALGAGGGFMQSKGNSTEAHQNFMRAAEICRGLLYEQSQSALLGLMTDQERINMHITYADLLKASSKGLDGQRKLDALETAAAEYQTAPNSHSARAGLAEVYVMLGEYHQGIDRERSEQYYLDGLNLCEALLTAGQLPETIKDRAAILKSISTLTWALNRLANFTNDPDYTRAALSVYQQVLNLAGDQPPAIADLELNGILTFIAGNLSDLLSLEVRQAAQLDLSTFILGYIGALRTLAKDSQDPGQYNFLLSELQRYYDRLPAVRSLHDERFRLNLLKTEAEIYLYDLKNYPMAQQLFDRILAEIESNQFGTDDPELNGTRISAQRGLAEVYIEQDGNIPAAIQALERGLALAGDHPTGDIAIQAVRIHLRLADIYTTKEEDRDQALEQVVIAQSLLLIPELEPNDAIDLRADAYYALGEIYRLLDQNYELAAAQYQAGIAALAGANDPASLAKLHAALTFLYIEQQNFSQAEAEAALAQANLENATEGVIDMVDSAVTALRRGELDNTAYVQFGAAFQSNTFEGNDPQNNWPINLQLGVPVWQNLKLNLGYSYGPGHSTHYHDSAALEDRPRMSSTGHHLNFGATYEDEFGNWQFKANPYFAFDIYDYTVNGYVHPADYSTIIDSYTENGNYFAATQGFNSELFYKLLPELQIGSGFGLSVTERSGILPSQAAELQTSEEFPDIEKPELESDPFLSWYLHPQVRWNGISLGFRAGDSAYDVSEQGFWPLENRDTMRYAATLGYSNLFTFCDDDKLFLKLDLGSEVGTHLFLNGSAGVGYEVSDNFIPQVILSGSYFNDFNLDTSSYSVGLGLRINFDLTPGSDD